MYHYHLEKEEQKENNEGLCNFTDAKDEEIRTVFCFDGFTSSIYKCIFKCTKKLFFEVFGYDFRQEKLLSECRKEELACFILQLAANSFLQIFSFNNNLKRAKWFFRKEAVAAILFQIAIYV